MTVALGLPSIVYTEGRCAGGGTEVNSGLYRRPPAETLDRWRREYSIDDFVIDDIEQICDEVESALSVQTVPGQHTGAASEKLRLGAERMGWRHDEIPRWMTYPERGRAVDGKRQSMTETYLPRARRAGASTRRTPTRSTGRRRGVATRAELTDSATGTAVTVAFEDVFVCAGVIQTPAILQRAGFRHRVGGAPWRSIRPSSWRRASARR